MHYLPCNHCGHLNEAKSEYMVLCEKCGKKMKNTYPQWRESRTKGTYEEYLAECCIDGAVLDKDKKAKEIEKSRNKKTGITALVLGAAAAVFICVAIVAYGSYFKSIFQETFGTGAGQEWTEQQVGTEGLVLSFPKTFENADALVEQLPPAAKSHFEKLEASIAGFSKEFIAVAFTMVTNNADTGNLKRYADLGLEMITSGKSSNLGSIETENYTIDDYPAILKRGTFTEGDKSSRFTMLLVGKERNFWMIMVVNPADDKKAQRIVKKFISSVKIRKDEY